MKIPKIFALLALPLASVLASPQAYADTYGPLTITVWSGTYHSGMTDIADNADTPSGPPTATFTYTGPIDFINNNCQTCSNTFQEFFGASNEAFISGLTSSQLSTLNSDVLSTEGESGNSIVSYFDITGTLSGNGQLGLASDDGACLYLSGTAVSALCHAAPQDDTTTYTASPNAGAGTPFRLDYVEANGAPSDLILSGASYATPEPSSLALLGSGMLGLVGFARRRFAA